MNPHKHLRLFFEKSNDDQNLNPSHITVYIALFHMWCANEYRNPISINKAEIMRLSKITSIVTYHKCLKNLHTFGYIDYHPSFHPYKGSHVLLINWAKKAKNTNHTK